MKPHIKPPTMKDVAALAGVHFTTVSLAFKGNPRIPAETREKILRTAATIGYKKDPAFMALCLRRGNARTKAPAPRLFYITNRSVQNGLFDTAHHRQFVAGAKAQSEALGYAFELVHIDSNAHTNDSLHHYLRREQARGLILGAFEPDRARLALPWEDYCVTKIDTPFLAPELPYVATDQFDAVLESYKMLRTLGYKRIGLVMGQMDDVSTESRHRAAVLLAQSRCQEAERVAPLLLPLGNRLAEAVPQLKRWIADESPDAVVSNWTNIKAMIKEAGTRCPEEIASASICLGRKDPRSAGIVANLKEVGAQAARTVARMLQSSKHQGSQTATHTLVKGTWNHGRSAPQKH